MKISKKTYILRKLNNIFSIFSFFANSQCLAATMLLGARDHSGGERRLRPDAGPGDKFFPDKRHSAAGRGSRPERGGLGQEQRKWHTATGARVGPAGCSSPGHSSEPSRTAGTGRSHTVEKCEMFSKNR
jgi:hypothetical protein